MSYQRDNSKMYMMPVHFGPCVTPRQNKDGERFVYDQPTIITKYTVVYETNPAQLEALLPQGFTLATPHVVLNVNMLRNIAWLAGNGYNLLGVSVPVVFNNAGEAMAGNLLLVMWENHADPIITGREQLGYSKIYAEIDDISIYGGIAKTSLRTWGFTFLEMEFDSARQPENREELVRVLNNPRSKGIFHYKYIPHTGAGFTDKDVECVILNPKTARLPLDVAPQPAEDLSYLCGQVRWSRPEWKNAPTQHSIIQMLGDLEIKRYVGATKSITHSLADIYDQTVIKTIS